MMRAQNSILLVSDEQSQQLAVQQALQSLDPECEITVVESTDAAIERLSSGQFHSVFCLLGSGPEDAVNFMTEIWDRLPSVSRFVLAPAIDAETQLRCAFGAHHYLATPLDPQVVRAALAESGAKRSILPDEQVQLLIARIRNLPSRPSVYFEVLHELRSEQATAASVAEIIQEDPGIAAKLIQVVNSIFYGRAEAVHNLHEAVLFLGLDVTSSIVLSLEALSRFDKVQPFPLLAEQIWTHSRTLAELSGRITQSLGFDRRGWDQAYLAGLLHDLGKLVLAQNYGEQYRLIFETAERLKHPLFDLETEQLGFSHAEAGAYLLASWGLPLSIVEAVAGHHAPPEALARITPGTAVHIAEQVLEGESPVDEIIQGYPLELGLSKHLDAFCELVPFRAAPICQRPVRLETPHDSASAIS